MKKNSFIILTILIAVFILSNCSNQKIVAKNTAIEVATNPIDGNIVKHDCNSFASAYPVKMNVLYIGVDNPIFVSSSGILSRDLRVKITNGTIAGSEGHYVVRVDKLGDAYIYVGDASGQIYNNFQFRVKRIPDPVAVVAKMSGGIVTANEFRDQKGLAIALRNFDFDAKFSVVSYDIVYVPYKQDKKISKVNGSEFNFQALDYVKSAMPGDVYLFENIIVKALDEESRSIPGINFRII